MKTKEHSGFIFHRPFLRFHFDVDVMTANQNEIGNNPSARPIERPVCFFADGNSQEADRVLASSIVGGIIVQGLVFVCAILHTFV
jgi:hypothetical protein